MVLGLGLQRASAFSLLGAFDDWQTAETGFGFGEIGGSKDLGEEFRVNSPTLTYGFHSTFLDFFGADGVAAVDQAMAIMNKLPAPSKMSADLSEFLLQDAQLSNDRATTLGLIDLKSETLGMLLEHLGLAGEEHIYDLQKRVPLGGTCQFSYQVVIRNFNPVTLDYTPYVNGALYTYDIVDFCPAAIAFAVERTVDPTSIGFTAVASHKGGLFGVGGGSGGLRTGGYYLNLTRDDAGGLRYIYRKNNYNNEALSTGAVASQLSGAWVPVDFGQTNAVSTNNVALRPGIEKVRFKKTRYDSLLGSFFRPFVQTDKLKVVAANVVNGQSKLQSQVVRRLVTQPDILFTAGNLNTLPGAIPVAPFIITRSINYIPNGLPGFGIVSSVGPGTIDPQTVFTFHKASPHFFNQTPSFLDEATSFPGFRWGSFDGSTNEPVVYPQGTSVAAIENLVLSR